MNRILIETFSPAVRHTTVKASFECSVLLIRRRLSFDVTGAVPAGRVLRRRGGLRASAQGLRDVRRPQHHARLVDPRPPVWPGDAGLIWFRTIREPLTAPSSRLVRRVSRTYGLRRRRSPPTGRGSCPFARGTTLLPSVLCGSHLDQVVADLQLLHTLRERLAHERVCALRRRHPRLIGRATTAAATATDCQTQRGSRLRWREERDVRHLHREGGCGEWCACAVGNCGEPRETAWGTTWVRHGAHRPRTAPTARGRRRLWSASTPRSCHHAAPPRCT